MRKIYSLITILLFLIILSAPGIKSLLKQNKVAQWENRVLAKKPDFITDLSDISRYTDQVDNYLSDNFGFRKNFIETNSKIHYYLFNDAVSKQITIGENDFIFFNSHNSKKPHSIIKFICEEKEHSKTVKQRIRKNFSWFIEHYTKLGYATSIAIIPLKAKIYPENLPSREKQWCADSRVTWADENLTKINPKSVYYPLEKLRSWKSSFPVYLPSFFHWEGHLPYRVAEDIMLNHLNITPDLSAKIEQIEVQSDLQRFLQGIELKEKSVNYSYKDHNIKKCHGKKCVKDIEQVYKKSLSFHYARTQAPFTGRKILLLTDSFGADVFKHFIRGFDEVSMINMNYLSDQERVPFFEFIEKEIESTHILLLMNSGGIYSNASKLNKVLLEFESNK